MSTSNNSTSGGVGFFGLLTIVFIALKLVGTIDWTWAQVLMPLWVPITLVLFVAGIVGVILTIKEFIK